MILKGKHRWARDCEIKSCSDNVYCLLYYYDNKEYVLACLKKIDNLYEIHIIPEKCCDNIYLTVLDNYHKDYSRWYNRDVTIKSKELYINLLSYIGEDSGLDTAKLKAEIKIAELGY